MVSNILRLNKLENQQIEVQPEPYDLCRQRCECALQYKALWEQKQIIVDVDMEERLSVTADESMLELVWNNLFSNALKFTEPGDTSHSTEGNGLGLALTQRVVERLGGTPD